MNVAEVESLLYRIDATYHGAHLSDVERKVRCEEWFDSGLQNISWQRVGHDAWRKWKQARDRPPTLHQYLDACRNVVRYQQLTRPALPQPVPTDDERERVAAVVAEAHASLRTRPQAAADDG